ncbi:hypothetical protein [Roseobacter sp. A03A-229]
MKTVPAALAALFLCNCTPQNLYVAHESVVGLNAKVNQARQQGQLLFGYDRDFVTIIPTNVPVEDNEQETEAMALVHCTRLVADGIYLAEYRDFTATGKAADQIANDPARIRSATSCDQLAKENE